MKNILLATDLTAYSDRAMERAIKLAKDHQAHLYVIHILPNYKDKKLQESLTSYTKDIITSYMNSYKNADGINYRIEIIKSDSTYAQILSFADRIKADLIVMGMHGKSKFTDLFVGTTIERLAKKSFRPTLIVRNKPTGDYKTIMASVDYSPASRKALRFGMKLAPKGTYNLMHTYTVPVLYTSTMQYATYTFSQTEKEQKALMDKFYKKELANFQKRHSGKPEQFKYTIIEGLPGYSLIKQAKEEKSDLITVGAHSASSIIPSKLGGVAEYILSNPPCDVLIAR